MKLIVGLGNPGKKYEKNRHNLGRMVLDRLADKAGIQIKPCRRTNSERGQGFIGKVRVMLAEPAVFMNLSGDSVGKLKRYYKIKTQDIWTIYDDLDLPLGKIRVRKKGSAGGHRGLESIISHLKTDKFNRLKIGLGSNREKNIPAEKYVLQDFGKKEWPVVDKAIDQAVELLLKEIK